MNASEETKYTSEELNNKIREICNDGNYDFSMENGKAIPYIGWWWRDFNFDRYPYSLGFIPDHEYVGFMVRNKWGYPSISLTNEQSVELRYMLENTVDNPNEDALVKVYNYIQETIWK